MRTALRSLIGILLSLSSIGLAGEKTPLGEAVRDINVADHWIYDDWERALAEAKASGKPILAVVRCVPCPPGKALDTAVMQPDQSLAELEKKFVCVRLIEANRLDLDLFQYDFDMSWSAMFLNADRTIYGRYGSRDASGPTADRLLSLAAFQKAAERALELHAAYPSNKSPLAAKTGPQSIYATPREIPGLTDRPAEPSIRQQCIHCHMVKEYALRAKWEAGKLTADDLYVFPQPTNIGLTTNLDDGLLIDSVAANSAAAEAGLAPGDSLVSLNGQPLISLADIQWVLNSAPHEGKLAATVRRGGQVVEMSIPLRKGWKKYDIGWRASSWYGLRQGLKTEALSDDEKANRGISRDGLALLVKNLFGKSATVLADAGVNKDDVIVAVDGKTDAMSESDFLVWLRLGHGPKDAVTFTIFRDGKRRDVAVPMW